MPVYRPRLSRAEEAMDLDCLQQLEAEGIDVEITDELRESSRALDIVVAGPAESTVFESQSGGVFYAVPVRLIALRQVILAHWGLSVHYDDQVVAERFDDRTKVCQLGGLEFRRIEVLNHRIEDGLRIPRNQMVEGWLLATGLRRVPIEYGNLAVPFEVIFWDQFGQEFRADGKLSVARTPRRAFVHKPRSLYEGGPAGLSVGEETRRRFQEMRAQERSRKESTICSDSKFSGAIPGRTDKQEPGGEKGQGT